MDTHHQKVFGVFTVFLIARGDWFILAKTTINAGEEFRLIYDTKDVWTTKGSWRDRRSTLPYGNHGGQQCRHVLASLALRRGCYEVMMHYTIPETSASVNQFSYSRAPTTMCGRCWYVNLRSHDGGALLSQRKARILSTATITWRLPQSYAPYCLTSGSNGCVRPMRNSFTVSLEPWCGRRQRTRKISWTTSMGLVLISISSRAHH